MRLTRRDALAALAGSGIVAGGTAAVLARDEPSEGRTDDSPIRTMVAVAEVVYPSEVRGVDSFVRTYVESKAAERPDFRDGVVAETETLAEYASVWEGSAFRALDPPARDELLHRMGVHTADPDSEGTDPERVRFHVVNELLYALYTSPTGGELVGIENPQGYPGGTESYRRGPATDDETGGSQ
jgi:hypothetical protein